MRQLWMRAGLNLSLTEEEANAILAPGASADAIDQTVKKIILEGRYSFSGESYIPQPCIEQYNDAYGTDYKADDIDFNITIDTVRPVQKAEIAGEEAICPICGSGNLKNQSEEDEYNGDSFNAWTCEDCGSTGTAGYDHVLDQHYDVAASEDDAEDDEYEDCSGECVGCDRACADRIEV